MHDPLPINNTPELLAADLLALADEPACLDLDASDANYLRWLAALITHRTP